MKVGVLGAILISLVWLVCPPVGSAQSNDLEAAVQLEQQVVKLYAAGHFGEAIKLAVQILAIHEKVLGPEHPDTATSLNNLAVFYQSMGAYAQAEPLFTRALAIREKALGPEHPATATSLNNLAELYRAMGASAQAEPLYKRALAISEKARGPEHPATATILNNFAALYLATGAYAEAEPLNKRALAIREKVLGPDHPDTAMSLNSLAALYYATGAYAETERLLKRALAIREKVLGPEHPDTAASLNNLAALYLATGAYVEAEPLYTRALAICKKALGPEHPATATSLNNFAGLYHATGAYAQAELLYTRALAISEKALGSEHPATATILNNLAEVYRATGAYAQAEPLYKRALAVRKKALGPKHPDTAASLNNLALLYYATGAYAQAEPLYKRVVAILENELGPEHPDTATGLNNLALLYNATGAYAQAEPLYRRALAIKEKTLGPEHPETGASLNNLAELDWAQERWSEAAGGLERATQGREAFAGRVLVLGDESRKRAYAETLVSESETVVTFSLAARGKVAGAESLGLQVVLQRKGRVLDILADSFGALRRSLTPQDQQLLEQWREANAQYATLLFRGPEKMPAEKYRELLGQVKGKAESLEGQLSQRSAAFSHQVETVTVERVQRAMQEGAVLIEWFRYQPFNPKANEQEPMWGAPRYMAYVLKHQGAPVAVDVGEARGIETTISDLLAALRNPRSAVVTELARELDGQLMQPLRPHVGDAERVLFSPDGQLNLLPFGVLIDDKGRYLTQSAELTYLTSGRDLLRVTNRTASRQAAVVIADPDFGPLSRTDAQAAADTTSRRSVQAYGGALQFTPLPGTAAEAQALQSILKLKDGQVLTRGKATEAALKQLKGPRILHLATHGFFLADQARDLNADVARPLGQGVQRAAKGENPLLRSGLALAGANQLRSGPDDGILTALEVAGLDLAGTELAVLSACETGIGQVQNGEGVYGLRRALVLAGVQTQVTSLWKVDDAATKDLMVDYYGRLNAGVGRSAALRAAQLAMLADPQRSHPYYWASFVTIGEWN